MLDRPVLGGTVEETLQRERVEEMHRDDDLCLQRAQDVHHAVEIEGEVTVNRRHHHVDAADLVDARVTGTIATVAVKFAAKLASATLDRSGAVIDGSTTAVVDHLDVWTFTRQLGSRDPNWQLSATQTVH